MRLPWRLLGALWAGACPLQHVSGAPQARLGDVQVLLPYTSAQSQRPTYVLEGYGGCFSWKSTDSSTIKIEPITVNGCSTQARITALHRKRGTYAPVTVMAKELSSNQQLECKVRVEEVRSIELNTKSKYLNRDELEVVEVEAKDKDQNTFSNVTGLRVSWQIKGPDHENKLHIVRFTENNVEAEHVIHMLEAEGHQSTKILVKGQGNGTVTIVAQLAEPEYQKNIETQADFTVYDPFEVVPVDVQHVQSGGSMQYHLLKRGQNVALPSEQYSWTLNGGDSCKKHKIADNGLFVAAVVDSVNECSFTVTDRYATDNTKTRIVIIGPPDELGFGLAPTDKTLACKDNGELIREWHLLQGTAYEWKIDAFLQGHNVTNGSRKLDLSVQQADFTLQAMHPNNWLARITPLRKGTATLAASFKLQGSSKVVHKTATVNVVTPIKIEKQSTTLLALDAKHSQEFTLKATGGSGKQSWTIVEGASIAEIRDNGNAARVVVKQEGRVVVRVADDMVCFNTDTIEMHAVPIASLKWVPFEIEAEVDKELVIPLDAFAGLAGQHSERLTDCKDLSITFRLGQPGQVFDVLGHQAPPVGKGGCVAVRVVARAEGHDILTAEYIFGSKTVTVSIDVFGYHPPRVVAGPNSLLTVRSSIPFLVNGGPLPHPLNTKYHVHTATGSGVTVRPLGAGIAPSDARASSTQTLKWEVKCTEEGTHTITFEIGNSGKYRDIPLLKRTVDATIRCEKPGKVEVERKFDAATRDLAVAKAREHMGSAVQQMSNEAVFDTLLAAMKRDCPQEVALPGSDVLFQVTVSDSQGRKFDNASGVALKWESDTPDLTFAKGYDPLIQRVALKKSAAPGVGTLSVLVDGTNVKHTVKLNIVAPVKLEPNTLRLTRYPPSSGHVAVLGGSMHLKVNAADTEVARTGSMQGGKLEVIPAGVGKTSVSVTDSCFLPPISASAAVEVVEVTKLIAHACNMVEVDGQRDVYLLFKDVQGVPLSADKLAQLHITPVLTSGLRLRGETPTQLQHELKYVVQGTKVGPQTIVFVAHLDQGEEIRSDPVTIEVIDQLRLVPASINKLFLGGKVEMSINAPPAVNATYSSTGNNVFTVTPTGLVVAVGEGKATLWADTKCMDPFSSKQCDLGRQSTEVEVTTFKGVKISASSHTLYRGTELSVYAEGLEGETPLLTLGTAALMFEWESSDPQVIDVDAVYHKANVAVKDEHDFSAWIRAKRPGKATLTVRAKPVDGRGVPTHSVEFTVVEPLLKSKPVPEKKITYVLAHNAEVQMETNLGALCTYKTLRLADTCPVSVSSTGLILANGRDGSCLVEARCEEHGIVQSAMQQVEVRPIAWLSVQPVSGPQPLSLYQPLGSEMCLVLHLHDRDGRLFDALPRHIPIQVEQSRDGIVDVTRMESGNCHYILKTRVEGEVVLRFSIDETPRADDYLRVRVRQGIYPRDVLVAKGMPFCFFTPPPHTVGKWEVTDPKPLILHPTGSGAKAEVVALGTTRIVFKGQVAYATQATVANVASAKLQHTEGTSASNAGRGYRIQVSFFTSEGRQFSRLPACPPPKDLNSVTYTSNVKYECSFENGLLPAKPYVDPQTGNTYCVIEGTMQSDAKRRKFLSRTSGVIKVSVAGTVIGEATIPFTPAFVATTRVVSSGGKGTKLGEIIVEGYEQHEPLGLVHTEAHKAGHVTVKREVVDGKMVHSIYAEIDGVESIKLKIRSATTDQTELVLLEFANEGQVTTPTPLATGSQTPPRRASLHAETEEGKGMDHFTVFLTLGIGLVGVFATVTYLAHRNAFAPSSIENSYYGQSPVRLGARPPRTPGTGGAFPSSAAR